MANRISDTSFRAPNTMNAPAATVAKEPVNQQAKTEAGKTPANVQQGMDKAFAAMQWSMPTLPPPPPSALQAPAGANVLKLRSSTGGNTTEARSYAATGQNKDS